ncbi:MAG: thymidine phosphorylase [Candidatus Poseidoniales archaeon]|nr:MAG: thymidine phosphorylase [Candidatus Poseidoniales archaeon]
MISMDIEHIAKLISAVESKEMMNLEHLAEFINGVANHSIPVEMIEKWLKAVHSHSISVKETTILTKEMMHSGAILDWPNKKMVVDKHSTGGVGDKMSLMLAPALAACGVMVPMLAGRGLGHTGGTIDKLESIPGFNCSLSPSEMKEQVQELGCCIAAQNDAIAPADGLLYAIRDVTNTIDSIPLITASIISKKAAEGLGSLVLDVKCGSAAFMKTRTDAEALAKSMVGAAKGLGINTTAQITQMDFPIGKYVGNSLEVVGSVEVLQGNGSKDTRDLVIMQGSALLLQSGKVKNSQEGIKKIAEVLDNGLALAIFEKMCVAQGVTEENAKKICSDPKSILPKSESTTTFASSKSGYVTMIDSMALAEIARKHGAGRFNLEDEIIPEIGFEVLVEQNQKITEGEQWLLFHHNAALNDEEIAQLNDSISVENQVSAKNSRLISTIS